MNTKIISSAPKHPEYINSYPVWETIDDCLLGQDRIKLMGEKYLKKTIGMSADPVYGDAAYFQYKEVATFPEYPLDYLLQLNGLLWQREPQLSLPDEMDSVFIPSPSYDASKSFMDVYHETSDFVLKYARHGILLDPPANSLGIDTYPRMVQYNAYQIIHWGTDTYKGQQVVKFILLDESSYTYNNRDLSQKPEYKYRFLGLKTRDEQGNELDTPVYYTYVSYGNFDGAIFDPPFDPSKSEIEYMGKIITFPNINGTYMDVIPFFCFGATSMRLSPERPIIYPLCECSLDIYKLSADYRMYLYKQGFAILFGTGFSLDSGDIYVGTQKAVLVENKDAKLSYVSTDGVGLSEYRLALENLHKNAINIGINLFKSSGDETGQSVLRHTTLKTASLKSIATTMAYGFTCICKTAARWRGLPESEIDSIEVIPNLEFSSAGGDTASLMNMYGVYSGSSTVLTPFDMYCWLRKNDLTPYNSFEEWEKAIEDQKKQKLEEKIASMSLENNSNKTSTSITDEDPITSNLIDNKAKMGK